MANDEGAVLANTMLLASVKNMRNKVWNNPDKKFVTKITKKSSGTIINAEFTNQPLDFVAGTYKLAYIDPRTVNNTELIVAGEPGIYYGTNKHTQYNTDAIYTEGAEYLLLDLS